MKTLIIVAILIFLCNSLELIAQVTINTLDTETYDEAVRIVFPANSMAEGYAFSYMIRVKPSSDPEFSLRVVEFGGKVRITKSESLNGNLFTYFSDLAKREDLYDAVKLAERVKLKDDSKLLTQLRFSKIHRAFGERLTALTLVDARASKTQGIGNQQSGSVIIHGTNYEIEYTSERNEFLSFKVYDFPIDARKFHSPMVPWIKQILLLFDPAK